MGGERLPHSLRTTVINGINRLKVAVRFLSSVPSHPLKFFGFSVFSGWISI